MRVAVLGRPALCGPDGPVPLRSEREAALLAVLVAEGGRTVRAEALEDEVWEGRRVGPSTLRVTIGRLRRRAVLLGGDVVGSEPAGYRLLVDPTEVDSVVVNGLVAAARRAHAEGDAAGALALLERAEGPWRGEPFDGFDHLPSVRPERDQLRELRGDAWELRAALLLDEGDAAASLAVLDRLIARQPLRESAWALLITAQGRAGRASEAVASYRQLADMLDEQLGVAPSGGVRAAHDAVVAGRAAGTGLGRAHRPSAPIGRVARRRDPAVLAGRDAEGAALAAALDRTGRGVGVVVVSGEPGIGKTTLVDAALQQLGADREVPVLVGRGDRTGTVPLQAVLGALGSRLGPAGGRDGVELARMLEATTPGGAAAEPDVALRRHRLLRLAVGVVGHAVGDGGGVLVVDDAHWADPFTVAFLDELLREGAALDLAVVLAMRPDPGADSPLGGLLADLQGRVPIVRLPLRGLDPASVGALLGGEADAETVGRVHRASGGNPLYARELAPRLGAAAVPLGGDGGLEVLLRARLGELRPEVAAVVQAAAVLGEELDAGVLATVMGMDRGALAVPLAEAVRANVLAPVEGLDRYAFVHGVVRWAAADLIDPALRPGLHLAAGRTLATTGAGHAEVAWHLERARPAASDVEVATALIMAGGEALARGDLDAATRAYRSVVGLAAVAPDHLARARLALGSVEADPAGAVTMIGQGVLDAIAAEDWTLAADGVVARTRFGVPSTIPEALVETLHVDEVLAHLPDDELERRVRLLAWRAEIQVNIDDAATDRALSQAEALLGPDGDPVLARLVAYVRLRQQESQGAPPAAHEARTGALEAQARAAGDLLLAARIGVVRQGARLRMGALDAVRDDQARYLDLSERAQDPTSLLVHGLAGVAASMLGAPLSEVEQVVEEAAASSREGMTGVQAMSRLLQIAVVRREQLGLHELRPLLEMALAASPRRLPRPVAADACVQAGERAAATAHLDALVDEVGELQPDWTYAATLAFAAEAAAGLGHRRLATALGAPLAALEPQVVVGCSVVFAVGHVDRYRGLVATLDGDLDAAVALHASARVHDTGIGAPLWAAWAAHGEADARVRRDGPGDAVTAADLLARAATTASTHGSPRLAAAVAATRALLPPP